MLRRTFRSFSKTPTLIFGLSITAVILIVIGTWGWDRYHPDVPITSTQKPGPSPLLAPIMISTPERALEEFIQAMEADDIEKT